MIPCRLSLATRTALTTFNRPNHSQAHLHKRGRLTLLTTSGMKWKAEGGEGLKDNLVLTIRHTLYHVARYYIIRPQPPKGVWDLYTINAFHPPRPHPPLSYHPFPVSYSSHDARVGVPA